MTRQKFCYFYFFNHTITYMYTDIANDITFALNPCCDKRMSFQTAGFIFAFLKTNQSQCHCFYLKL